MAPTHVGLLIILSYLLGAVPFSLLLGFLKGVDIRKTGSGNVGATNLARTCGKFYFFPAFLLDFSKGFVPVTLFAPSTGESEAYLLSIKATLAFAPVLGHIFSPFLGFKGGKGVATGAGALFALLPTETALALAMWAVVLAVTKTVGVASCAAACCVPIAFFLKGGRSETELLILGIPLGVLCALILWRHRANLKAFFSKK